MAEAEKQLRREKNLAWQATPEAAVFRERQRQRRIEYNKTKLEERLSPAARKASGERITRINKTRKRSPEELAGVSTRAKANSAAGKFRRGPMTDAERELHCQRMLGNTQSKGRVASEEEKAAASARMKQSNPIKSWLEEIASSQSVTPVFRQFMT